MSDKISIRFFNDREVRAAWDSTNFQWLFSVVYVIAILTESKNPRNYWKVMKHRLAKDGNELVTKCNQLKMAASDGKRYLTDCLSQADILSLIDASLSSPQDLRVTTFCGHHQLPVRKHGEFFCYVSD